MPEWPPILSRAGFQDIVELSVLVNELGNVDQVKILKSSPVVDTACVAAALKWKYEAGRIADGTGHYRPSKFWVHIFFDWNVMREPEIVQAY
jgi:TonB family protein